MDTVASGDAVLPLGGKIFAKKSFVPFFGGDALAVRSFTAYDEDASVKSMALLFDCQYFDLLPDKDFAADIPGIPCEELEIILLALRWDDTICFRFRPDPEEADA